MVSECSVGSGDGLRVDEDGGCERDGSEPRFDEWFRCPRCGASSEDVRVVQSLAVGNVSVDVSCRRCGFACVQRDWRAAGNLRRWIRVRRFFKSSFLTHPVGGREVLAAARCPECGAAGEVVVEVERERRMRGCDEVFVSVGRARCGVCGVGSEHVVSHQ